MHNLPNLRFLKLNSTRVSDASLKYLIAVPNLEILDLRTTRVSAKGFARLKAAIPKARIAWSEPNRIAAEAVMDAGGTVSLRLKDQPYERVIKNLAELPAEYFQVRRINLDGVQKPLDNVLLGLDGLTDPEFARLEARDLSGTTIADGNLARLQPLTNMLELSMARTQVTDQGLSQMKGLPKLRRLVLDGAPISGWGLAALKNLPLLAELQLGCPTVTDLGIAPLAELKGLKRLSLAGSGLSDEGLSSLAGLKELVELNLMGTKVTTKGVDALRQKLPKCRIVYEQRPRKP